jgi:hypothetical protein
MTLRSWLKETSVVRGLKMRVMSSPQWFFVQILRFLLPDALLRAGVAEHGEIDNWKIIALTIPGRTNKACRKVILLVVDIFFSRNSLLSAFPNLALVTLPSTQCQENSLE